MEAYARVLFGVAGAVNLLVGVSILLAWNTLAPFLQLDPVHGANLWLVYFAGSMIGLFGVVYLLIAHDPRTYRPCIAIFTAGKVLAFASAVAVWLADASSARLSLLLFGDIVFAALFIDYLRRTAR
jgi:hypothetical protein